MAFGGTNWGNLAEPTVYTSYVSLYIINVDSRGALTLRIGMITAHQFVKTAPCRLNITKLNYRPRSCMPHRISSSRHVLATEPSVTELPSLTTRKCIPLH